MNARELVKHCRAHREGAPPAGDIREAGVLRDVLTMILEQRLEDLTESAPKQAMRYDLDNGRMVALEPAPKPADPREDSTAHALATLIGYIEDLPA